MVSSHNETLKTRAHFFFVWPINLGSSSILDHTKRDVRLARRVRSSPWRRVLQLALLVTCCEAQCGGTGGIWIVRCRYQCERRPGLSGPVLTAGSLFSCATDMSGYKRDSIGFADVSIDAKLCESNECGNCSIIVDNRFSPGGCRASDEDCTVISGPSGLCCPLQVSNSELNCHLAGTTYCDANVLLDLSAPETQCVAKGQRPSATGQCPVQSLPFVREVGPEDKCTQVRSIWSLDSQPPTDQDSPAPSPAALPTTAPTNSPSIRETTRPSESASEPPEESPTVVPSQFPDEGLGEPTTEPIETGSESTSPSQQEPTASPPGEQQAGEGTETNTLIISLGVAALNVAVIIIFITVIGRRWRLNRNKGQRPTAPTEPDQINEESTILARGAHKPAIQSTSFGPQSYDEAPVTIARQVSEEDTLAPAEARCMCSQIILDFCNGVKRIYYRREINTEKEAREPTAGSLERVEAMSIPSQSTTFACTGVAK